MSIIRATACCLVLCSLAVSFAASAQPADSALPDFTRKLSLHPGLIITIAVSNAHDSSGSVISGDYQSVINIQDVTDKGTTMVWTSTYPTNHTWPSTVAYITSSYKLSIYAGPNYTSPDGFNSMWRPSREFYESLKSGKATPLEFDGYQSPGTIQKVAEEYLVTLVNEKKVRLHAIKGKTPQSGYFWFLDNPEFPLMLKSDSQIFDFYISAFSDTSSVAKDLVGQLQQKGTATSHSILFALNTADLSDVSKSSLDAIASFMKSDASVKLTIEGHTDDIGGPAFNLDLSRKRAESVKNYLVQHGIAADRLTVSGYGQSKPVATNKTAIGRALNRRVVFHEDPSASRTP